MSPTNGRLPVLRLLLGTGSLLITAGCILWFITMQPDRIQPTNNTWKETLDTHFAGDLACKECHQSEYEAHQRSGHSHTMHASIQGLNGHTFSDPVRHYRIELQERAEQLSVTIPDRLSGTALMVDWVLGSGKHAQTAVSVSAEKALGVEHRWTYFNDPGVVGLTPAHAEMPYDKSRPSLDMFGRPLDWQELTQCLGCHATAVPPQPHMYSKENILPNVQCERCHGPRKEHALLAQSGRGAEKKPVVTYTDASAYTEQCAQCHRGENNLDSAREEDLVRFQPYGLSKSLCYQKTPQNIQCSACHDPHDEVSHDSAQYRAVCLSCHESFATSSCPSSSTSDCVSCHMPASRWHDRVTFHDHRIQRPSE